ncbi:transposase [Thiohalocapsa sp.]|uniref:IS256 family transposase n=1 Tax=Thiohalocapsa sp. TaxID=2497641 RepID=UPI0025E0D6D4|nr:transposase [Thiohalocapsa sp.]
MNQAYQIVGTGDRLSSEQLATMLSREGQWLLPLVGLIEQAECAVDEVIDVMGRATIEAVLQLSAEQVAGPRRQGKADPGRDVQWHGSQGGRVTLAERQQKVRKPRLRRKAKGDDPGGEVPIPAYQAMRAGGERLSDRILEILLRGVSTRSYAHVLPEMAEQVGVSKSAISREAIEAGERELKALAERRFDDTDLLVIYIDGMRFGEYHVIAAVGVDASGDKHVLGLREGATENATVVKELLADLVERGVKPAGVEGGRRRLFVIDGAKALRAAIDEVFGSHNPVQRCRNHKRRNVLGHLPKDQHDQARATMSAAWKLEPKEGMAKIEQYAQWLERDWPSAAGSLREGLAETFTVKRLGLPGALCRCLHSTHLIDSSPSGLRQQPRRVTT